MPPHQRQQEDLAQDAVADDAEADKDESGGDGDRAVLENQQVKTPKDVDGAHDDDQPRPEAAIRFGVGILDLAHDAGDEGDEACADQPYARQNVSCHNVRRFVGSDDIDSPDDTDQSADDGDGEQKGDHAASERLIGVVSGPGLGVARDENELGGG